MQILYWHLTRPQTSTCGGSLSPPLLQRRDETGTLAGSTSPNSSGIFKQSLSPRRNTPYDHRRNNLTSSLEITEDTGDQLHRAMEIENDDQTPTFYLLNAVDLPDDEDAALNHHLDLVHGQNDHDNPYNGPLVAVGNGPSGDGGGDNGPPGGHYSHQARKIMTSKRKKRRSNDLAGILHFEEDSEDESAVNIGPSKSKKAKLVVNLYPENKGYSFAYQVPGSNECSESHAIPYSERYLLDSIDAQQIPSKILCRLEDRQGVNLMRYRNQVIAEIRDYRKNTTSNSHHQANTTSNANLSVLLNSTENASSSSPALMNGTGGTKARKEIQQPVVKQVMLNPTTESLLCDFDMIVEKACQDRSGWSAVLQQSSGDLSQLIADGSDSEYEYEVDIEASQNHSCNYLTYDQRLELEKNFVNQTAGPLCLDPSPEVSLIANRIQFEKLKWNTEDMKRATKRWEENPFKSNRVLMSSADTSLNAPSLAEGRLDVEPLYTYIMNAKAKSSISLRPVYSDKDALRLPPISYQDYPNVEPPKNMDDVLRIGQTPEPAQLRLFPNENSVRKIEEYILETERRKRPHTTTLSIFQRNGMESYFGELEMESFLDPNQPRIGAAPSSTKCQFELGSSRNVALYVKQFSDIFTEDGRRPCKITYQKVGQAPQVVYTNSYKSAATPTAVTTTTPTSPNQSQTTVTAVTAPVPQVVTAISSPGLANTSSSMTITIPSTACLPAATSTITTSTPNQPIVQTSAVVSSTLTSGSGVGAHPTTTVPVAGIATISQQTQALLQRPATPATGPSTTAIGTSPAATTAPSLPPVQIVHPQPRTNPQQQQQQQQQQQKVQAAGQRQTAIQLFSQQNQPQNIPVPQSPSPAANVNLNVNLSSSGLAGLTPQQVLTRPHIVNVNLQQQQQQQLLQQTQQRLLRMKQQQPNTALAKLLLTNLQTKPITVAVQPTPQNPSNTVTTNSVCGNNPSPGNTTCSSSTNTSSNATNANPAVGSVAIASPVDQQGQQNPLGSPIMISSPPSVSSTMTNPSPNVNVNVNASPNLSLNLNTISLDGLLSVSSANVNYGNTATISTNQAGSNLVAGSNVNLGLSRITNASSPSVNILRLNNNSGTTVATAAGGNTVQLATVQRQLAVSNALNGNVSILQSGTQQPQQRILINANSMNNLNLNSVGASEIEELSVPDLTTLLAGQPIQISQLGQQQHILTNAATGAPSQTTIDTTNLNLNLNVNLNSGTVVNSGEAQVQQHQIAKIQGGEWTTTAQAPPFLVFISPLRPMSIATQAATTTRQVTAGGAVSNPSTLSLNLGTVQASQQQLHQTQQIVQTQTAKVADGATRILLGTCNNGVAIKREAPPSSTASSVVSQGGSEMLSQNQVESNVDGHLLDAQQVVSSTDVVVDGVDSLFNALSEAIGPEQLQKLDAIGGSLTTAVSASSSSATTSQNASVVAESLPAGLKVVASSSPVNIAATGNSSSSSGSIISNNKNNSTNVITLSDLLGSHTVVSSSTGNASGFPSLILSSTGPANSNSGNSINTSNSNSSPTLSSLLNSVTVSTAGGLVPAISSASSAASTLTQSSIVSSTPRLSALLAGTPSADTVVVGPNGPASLLSPKGTADSSTGTTSNSYGTLLDRLAASLNQPQGTTGQMRTGASRLNPIATATPSVVLDHPVLAATLTQTQQQPSASASSPGVARGSTYRQIAPAPSPTANLNATTTASIGSNNVAVISSSDVQAHMQSPQLINLLGLVGNSTNATGPGQTRTIRISASSPANNPSPGSASR